MRTKRARSAQPRSTTVSPSSTHNSTHLDAPYHVHRTMDAALGESRASIAIHEPSSPA